MGKYSDIVKSKNETGKPDNQEAVKIDSSKAGKVESDKTSNAENQKTRNEDMVNLSIKVPRKLRQKWVAESRLRGTTLTAIITDYLKSELGE